MICLFLELFLNCSDIDPFAELTMPCTELKNLEIKLSSLTPRPRYSVRCGPIPPQSREIENVGRLYCPNIYVF